VGTFKYKLFFIRTYRYYIIELNILCMILYRLEESTHQLISLIQKTSTLKRTKLLYKQKLERRCADLQMAEAEVMIYL